MFPVGTVILEISINYYHLSYFLYHSLLSSDLCLFIFAHFYSLCPSKIQRKHNFKRELG